MRLFCGYDEREAIGYDVFVKSVQRRSKGVVIERLDSQKLPQGSNAFTFSRFLVPYLCGYKGWAVFADGSDMLCLADITELEQFEDFRYAVRVVKHDYRTRHKTKYIGTDMECPNLDYPRKNWASLMLINCEHEAWQKITAEYIATAKPRDLMQLAFICDSEIAPLPAEWNVLADENQPIAGAKILHWTAGIPAFKYYEDAPGADLWRAELAA